MINSVMAGIMIAATLAVVAFGLFIVSVFSISAIVAAYFVPSTVSSDLYYT